MVLGLNLFTAIAAVLDRQDTGHVLPVGGYATP
jgi:hypothetical protein